MAAIFQTTFSNAFYLNENVWILIPPKLVSNVQIDNNIALVQPVWCQAIIWINDGLGWRRIYVSLGLNVLTDAFYGDTECQ